jgi:hypothetical protein
VTNPTEERDRALAQKLSSKLDDQAAVELLEWAIALQAIRDSDQSAAQKAKQAMALSLSARTFRTFRDVLGDVLGNGVAAAKRFAWDDRGWPARLGLTSAVAAVVVAGSQGAGIAALGTAIGAPLWLVCGAGGTLLGTLVDELSDRKQEIGK